MLLTSQGVRWPEYRGQTKSEMGGQMDRITQIQGIKSNLHTYVFRHSFSRKVLEKYGIWHLKEVLGHQNVNTTQAYAESLSTKQLNKTDDVFDW
jgi:site-specific recombinase XerD